MKGFVIDIAGWSGAREALFTLVSALMLLSLAVADDAGATPVIAVEMPAPRDISIGSVATLQRAFPMGPAQIEIASAFSDRTAGYVDPTGNSFARIPVMALINGKTALLPGSGWPAGQEAVLNSAGDDVGVRHVLGSADMAHLNTSAAFGRSVFVGLRQPPESPAGSGLSVLMVQGFGASDQTRIYVHHRASNGDGVEDMSDLFALTIDCYIVGVTGPATSALTGKAPRSAATTVVLPIIVLGGAGVLDSSFTAFGDAAMNVDSGP